MAHLSRRGSSVQETENNTERDKATAGRCTKCATTPSWAVRGQVHPHAGSNGLIHTSSSLKHSEFLKLQVPSTVSHNEDVDIVRRDVKGHPDAHPQRSELCDSRCDYTVGFSLSARDVFQQWNFPCLLYMRWKDLPGSQTPRLQCRSALVPRFWSGKRPRRCQVQQTSHVDHEESGDGGDKDG